MSDPIGDEGDEPLVLADLLHHVLDKGVVIRGTVLLSIADIDLVYVGLSVVISSAETVERQRKPASPGLSVEARGDLSVLPPARDE